MSLVGMGIVFAVLVLLALSIKVLSMFDREPEADPEASSSASAGGPGSVEVSPPTSVSNGEITGQQVAAIAVALALSEPALSPTPVSLGSPSSGPMPSGASTGSWLQSGRMRSLGGGLGTRGRRGQ